MSPSRQRFVTLLLATTGAASSFAYANAEPAQHQPNAQANSASVNASSVLNHLDHAATLVSEGQVIRARAMILTLQDSPAGLSLSDEQDQRVWKLLAQIERTIQRTDRHDIALQKAQHALSFDRLVDAERQAQTVFNSSKSTNEQIDRANAISTQIQIRRDEAQPLVAATLRSAIDSFNQGDYTRAKTIINRIGTLGLDLDSSTRRKLTIYRSRITDLEQTRGETFGSPAPSMGMLAPESGASSEWLITTAQDMLGQPADEPSDEPSDEIVVEIVEIYEPDTQAEPEIDLVETARKFEAQTLLANANIAYEERRLNDALHSYNTLMSNFASYISDDERALAGQRLNEVEIALGVQGGPSEGGLNVPIEERSIIMQRLTATYDNLTNQANDALRSGDTTIATGLIAQARLEVQRARDVMPEAAYENYISDLDNMASNIAQREEQLRQSRLEQEAADRELRTLELETQRLNQRDERVLASLHRVRALQSELKYEEALEIVENILFLDPANPSGLLLKDIIEDIIVYRGFYAIQRDKNLSYAHESLENQTAMILPDFLMDYPDDWPQISFRRGATLEYAESESNRAVLTQLRETRMPVDFDDNSFEDVLAFIGSTADLDIDTDWESLADIGVDPDSPVTLRLNNVTLEVLLDRVLAKVSDPVLPASWAVQDGILTISSDDVLRQNTLLEIYDVRDLLFDVPEFDNAPRFNMSSGGSGGGGGGRSPFSGSSGAPDLASPDERVGAISDLIRSNVDPGQWASDGGSTSSLTSLNGNFIITTTPRYHREVIGLLNKLRSQRAIQISVEARYMSVDQNFFEQIGFDLDVYLNANNTEYRTARAIDPSILPSDYFEGDGTLVRSIQASFDINGDDVIDEDDRIFVFGPGNNGGTLPDGTVVDDDQFSIIRAAQNSFGLTETLAGASGFAAGILAANPALGITARFLDDVQVDFMVEATQADQRSVTLTAPRLTFTNGQRANIVVSTQSTYVSGLTAIVGSSSGAFNPTTDVLNDGVLLDITGVASADRRYVTMTVITSLAKNNLNANSTTVEGAVGGTGGTQGASNFTGTIQLPSQNSTQINTTVTVPDQGTIMLGGQRLVDEVQVETGVPVLSKIPILSRFFSNRIDVKEEKTLLVMIKPTILIQNEEEERHFPGLLDQLGG
ncbi:MAG: hypothetical protein JKY43_06270 [Phycisphaerales bacterium]|nr:hypothetical protein [Phycisphaerales bacterium]